MIWTACASWSRISRTRRSARSFMQAKRRTRWPWPPGSRRSRSGLVVSPDALFDVQIKRIHEYKRQLLNILQTVAHWNRSKADPTADWVPRVKIFGGKSAPGYAVAKEIIHLINDVAESSTTIPMTGDLLKIVYPPNYNVSMAEHLVPAADLSEQISTAGMEASGTGNMKFMMNGAPTIGTLDGANVEILREVGDENFFLFGMTTEEAEARRALPDQSRLAIEASAPLQEVLQQISEGRFSPDTAGPLSWAGAPHLAPRLFPRRGGLCGLRCGTGAGGHGLCRPRRLGQDGGDEHGAIRLLLVRPDDPQLYARISGTFRQPCEDVHDQSKPRPRHRSRRLSRGAMATPFRCWGRIRRVRTGW